MLLKKYGFVKTLFLLSVLSHFSLQGQESPYEFIRDVEDETTFNYLVTATYTYWQPYQDRMVTIYSVPLATTEPTGSSITPDFSPASGFKVGLGADTTHNGWFLFAEYTWFNNDVGMRDLETDSNISLIDSDVFYIGLYELEEAGVIDTLHSKFNNQFNIISFSVNKTFLRKGFLSITPWVGLLGAWEEQYLYYDTTPVGEDETFKYRFKQDWWGIGPYIGTDFSYFFMDHFGMFFRFGASIHLANHKVFYHVATYDEDLVLTEVNYNMREEYNDMEPMIETLLGIRMELPFKTVHILVDLAWELQTYFAHNGFRPNAGMVYADGNYAMQGLTATFGINF